MQSLTFQTFGEPNDVLCLMDQPLPEPGPGQVRVRLRLRPMNPSDLFQIRGKYGRLPELPAVAGLEGLGEVEALGDGVTGLALGQRVVFRETQGTWAEATVVPASALLPVPDGVPDEAAAQVMVNPLTAWGMIEDLNPPQGAWVIQTAAGSAVGRCVADLGRDRGFHVLNLVRREEQAEELRQKGEQALATTSPDWVKAAQALMGGEAFAVLDAVGGKQASQLLKLLRAGGTMLVYGALSMEPLQIPGGQIIYREFTVRGFMITPWKRRKSMDELRAAVDAVFSIQARGLLCPPVAARFPLANYREAAAQAEATGKGGKILLG